MKIYLVRHGEALHATEDPERHLSSVGQQDIEALGQFMKKSKVSVDRIYHSGKTRAEETANILYTHIKSRHEPEAVADFLPDDPIQSILSLIKNLKKDTLFVGHLPFIGELASYLTVGTQTTNPLIYQPGCALCLESHSGGWAIAWFLDPHALN